MLTRLRTPALAALAAASFVAVGCGGSDSDDVESSIKEFASALKDKDYDKACEGITSRARKQLESRAAGLGGGKCPVLLKRLNRGDMLSKQVPADVEFEKVTVKDDKATVAIKGDSEDTMMTKEDDEWKLDVGQ